ncbi:MAG: hypothetical protein ABR525_07570 [Candidatus Limnocylindria bacterium]
MDVELEATSRRITFGGSGPAQAPGPAPAVTLSRGATIRIASLAADGPLERLARQAALVAGTELAVSLRADRPLPFGDHAAALRDASAEALLVQPGNGPADQLVDLVEAFRAGCPDQHPAPRVLLAGGGAVRARAALGEHAVETLPDLRSPEGQAALRDRLREMRRGSSRPGIVLRDEAVERAALTLARERGTDVVVLDSSGRSTSIVHATPGGTLTAVHELGLGSGSGSDRVVARAGLDRVRRWIPWPVDAPSLLERVFNRTRWPDAVPVTPLALALEVALAHEAVAQSIAQAAECGIAVERFSRAPAVFLVGRVALLPRPAQSLLIAVDALEPRAVTTVFRERAEALLAQAALDLAGQGEAAELTEQQEVLALVVPVTSRRRASVRFVAASERSDERVLPGAFYVVPRTGPIDVSSSAGGIRGRGMAGGMGVVIDARGRPVPMPQRDAERIPLVARWYGAVGALAQA